jgi:hypothetical protein
VIVLPGILGGLALAAAAAAGIRAQLPDAEAVNPAVYAGVLALLLAIVTAAALPTARRAMRADSASLLRSESF